MNITEISKQKLVDYMEKSTKQTKALTKKYNQGLDTPEDFKTLNKRVTGQIMGKDKFYGRAKVPPSGKDKAYDMARKILVKKISEESTPAKPAAPKPAGQGKSITLQSGRIAAVGTPAGHQALSDYHRQAALTATSKKDYDNHVSAAQANGQAAQQLQAYAKTPEQYDKRAIDSIVKKASDLTSQTNAAGISPDRDNMAKDNVKEEQITEISRKVLSRYIPAAYNNALKQSLTIDARDHNDPAAKTAARKFRVRGDGIRLASRKLGKDNVKESTEEKSDRSMSKIKYKTKARAGLRDQMGKDNVWEEITEGSGYYTHKLSFRRGGKYSTTRHNVGVITGSKDPQSAIDSHKAKNRGSFDHKVISSEELPQDYVDQYKHMLGKKVEEATLGGEKYRGKNNPNNSGKGFFGKLVRKIPGAEVTRQRPKGAALDSWMALNQTDLSDHDKKRLNQKLQAATKVYHKVDEAVLGGKKYLGKENPNNETSKKTPDELTAIIKREYGKVKKPAGSKANRPHLLRAQAATKVAINKNTGTWIKKHSTVHE